MVFPTPRLLRAPVSQQPRQMLLIVRSSALFSLVKRSFGSPTLLLFGMSLARGWRWPVGASGTPARDMPGEVPLLSVWAMAAPTSRTARSANKPIALIMVCSSRIIFGSSVLFSLLEGSFRSLTLLLLVASLARGATEGRNEPLQNRFASVLIMLFFIRFQAGLGELSPWGQGMPRAEGASPMRDFARADLLIYFGEVRTVSATCIALAAAPISRAKPEKAGTIIPPPAFSWPWNYDSRGAGRHEARA